MTDRKSASIPILAVLLFVSVIITGCSDKSGSSSVTPTSFDPALQPTPPVLVNTGEDWESIIRSINDYDNWLFANPDPERVDDYMSERCTCNREWKRKLRTLRDRQWQVDGTGYEISEVSLQKVDRRTASIYVVTTSKERPVVDRNGRTVQEPPVGVSRHVYYLERSEDERWRIVNLEEVVDVGTTEEQSTASR